jgi:hypothetical protein
VTTCRWLRGLVAQVLAVVRQRRKAQAMTPSYDQHREPLLPIAGEEAMSPEQQQRLDRVRSIFHAGSQPLTVAKARYELIRRGVFDDRPA